jgi:hypothetical protein
MLNKQFRVADKGWSSRLGVVMGVNDLHRTQAAAVAGFYERGNELSGSIKGGECTD